MMGFKASVKTSSNPTLTIERYIELWAKENQDTTPTSLLTNTAVVVRIGRNTLMERQGAKAHR